MAVKSFTSAGAQRLAVALTREPRQAHLQGLTPGAGAYILARLFQQIHRPVLLLTPNVNFPEQIIKDLTFFLGETEVRATGPGSRVLMFPAHEVLSFRELSFDADVSCARLAAASVALTSREPWFMVAPAVALRQKLPPADRVRDLLAYVVAGESLERSAFLQHLLEGGYERRPVVEERGEFSVRGGVIDLFPPLYPQPVRLEFWGDEVESIRLFDPATQRSQGTLEDLMVLPASEVVLDDAVKERALARRSRRQDPEFWDHVNAGRQFPRIERHLAEFYDRPQTLWDFLPPDTVVVEWDPLILRQELAEAGRSRGRRTRGLAGSNPLGRTAPPVYPNFLPPHALGAPGPGPRHHLPGGEKRSPGRGTGEGRRRGRPPDTGPGAAPGRMAQLRVSGSPGFFEQAPGRTPGPIARRGGPGGAIHASAHLGTRGPGGNNRGRIDRGVSAALGRVGSPHRR